MSDHALDIIAAGAAARYYVLGGMDPKYADPSERDLFARRLARMSPSLAVAFLRGHVEHHETTPEPLAWHRLLGGVAVEVGAA